MPVSDIFIFSMTDIEVNYKILEYFQNYVYLIFCLSFILLVFH